MNWGEEGGHFILQDETRVVGGIPPGATDGKR